MASQHPLKRSKASAVCTLLENKTAVQEDENQLAEVVIVCEPEQASLMMGGLHPRGSLYERPINIDTARSQHAEFRAQLRAHGVRVLTVREILAYNVGCGAWGACAHAGRHGAATLSRQPHRSSNAPWQQCRLAKAGAKGSSAAAGHRTGGPRWRQPRTAAQSQCVLQKTLEAPPKRQPRGGPCSSQNHDELGASSHARVTAAVHAAHA